MNFRLFLYTVKTVGRKLAQIDLIAILLQVRALLDSINVQMKQVA